MTEDHRCPRFRTAFFAWCPVQGYGLPGGSGDRPMIPTEAAYAQFCATARFGDCPRQTGAARFLGDLIGEACFGWPSQDGGRCRTPRASIRGPEARWPGAVQLAAGQATAGG